MRRGDGKHSFLRRQRIVRYYLALDQHGRGWRNLTHACLVTNACNLNNFNFCITTCIKALTKIIIEFKH